MDFSQKKIAVVGLGLMGGSFIHAVKERFPQISVVGVTRNENTLKDAKRGGYICDGYCSVQDMAAFHEPDIFVLATPVQTIKTILADIADVATNAPIVTDLGSTKTEIQRFADSHFSKSLRFVGSHPMTGSHNAGYRFSDVALYKTATCFIIKEKNTDQEAFAVIRSLWEALESRVVVLDAERHDRIVSRISHLPHAVSFALVDSVARCGDEGFKYAGGGFKDFTRIAASDPRMWCDIFETNGENIVRDLENFKSAIESLIALVKDKNSESLLQYFQHISDYRRQM